MAETVTPQKIAQNELGRQHHVSNSTYASYEMGGRVGVGATDLSRSTWILDSYSYLWFLLIYTLTPSKISHFHRHPESVL